MMPHSTRSERSGTLKNMFVSIVIPCRNEAGWIERCLDSVIANDYPKERLEVVIADGMSKDGTRGVLAGYAKRHPFIKVIDNPGREQQLGLNAAILAARGDVIMRMDAHSTYKYDYISQCVRALQEHPADNVGGRWITMPRNGSIVGRAICMATTCVFGVGNAYYRLTSLFRKRPALARLRWDINVSYFCCRREVFDRIGLFNEGLNRSEDIDFRSRLKKAGYRTLFVPTIECYYLMRTRFSDFVRHMFKNGQWVLLPLNHSPNISFSRRHIVPLLFVMINLLAFIFAFVFHPLWYYLLAAGVIYMAINLFFSFMIALREREPGYFFILPFIFLTLHVSYGLGSVVGLTWLMSQKLAVLFGKKPEHAGVQTL